MPKGEYNKSGRFQKREVKEFAEEVIEIDRVTRVVKGGRKLRFRATVAIGNKKGKVGIGIGKSNEVTGAIQKAINKAKKCLFTAVLDGTTIPHRVDIKYKSAKLLLLPASEGTGIIAGGPVRKIMELAGVKDILSKCLGTSNKVNNTKAAFLALKQLRATPAMDRRAKQNLKKKMEAEEKAKADAQIKTAKPAAKPETKKPEAHKPAPKPIEETPKES